MKRMSFLEFAENRKPMNLRLIDVREPHEFDEVHVKGAELFPLSRLQSGELPEQGDQTIALICRSGGRSAVAASILEGEGFLETINIEGGTRAAIDAGDDYVER